MKNSKSIAGIIGPTLIVMVTSEMKIWNPDLYNSQIVPLVYLSGVLMFVAGISIVRTHNVWVLGWETFVTILGWLGMVVGLLRMFFPEDYLSNFKNDMSVFIIEILLVITGIFFTWKSYFSKNY